MDHKRKIAVLGGNSTSLALAIGLASNGHTVEIFSPLPVERYARTGAEGFAIPPGDERSLDTIHLLLSFGLPFDHNEDGSLNLSPDKRDSDYIHAKAGEYTHHHLHMVLADQVRKWESHGRIIRHEYCEVIDFMHLDSRCRGLITIDTITLDINPHACDTVVLAIKNPATLFTGTVFPMYDFTPLTNVLKDGAVWCNPHRFETNSSGIKVDENGQTDVPGIFAIEEIAFTHGRESRFSFIRNLTDGFTFPGKLKTHLESSCEINSEILTKAADELIAKNHAIHISLWVEKHPPLPWKGGGLSIHETIDKVTSTIGDIVENRGSIESWINARDIYENTRLKDASKWANRQKIDLIKLSRLMDLCNIINTASEAAYDSRDRAGTIAARWSDDAPEIEWE